ncbi:helix-turn-helix domain-containing protein [Acholeplasma hippikon]|uniref:Transcriptional repressor DicA n=1 Tax=Acholeplasma hippikon TaxID=264636 RepID=A0A449BLE4_9MOLU|nr:helix-turn-helix transcriptional regulator [Acholeplasma hippikon]VEU83254.1 transcriptional repressor DicA [Acholeplasma hippikon]
MNNEKNEIVSNIASNISYYRKKLNLTQLELAEKLNYSDKSISKWERGEGVPDIFVLKELSVFFGVSIDSLTQKRKGPFMILKYRNVLAHFYASICLLVGILVYGILQMLEVDYPNYYFMIYSMPAAALVVLIFYIIWQRMRNVIIYLTVFIWTLSLSIYLGLNHPNAYWVLIITIPIYLFFIFMIYVIYKPKKLK